MDLFLDNGIDVNSGSNIDLHSETEAFTRAMNSKKSIVSQADGPAVVRHRPESSMAPMAPNSNQNDRQVPNGKHDLESPSSTGSNLAASGGGSTSWDYESETGSPDTLDRSDHLRLQRCNILLQLAGNVPDEPERIDLLIKAKIDFERFGENALLLAIRNNHARIAMHLIELGIRAPELSLKAALCKGWQRANGFDKQGGRSKVIPKSEDFGEELYWREGSLELLKRGAS